METVYISEQAFEEYKKRMDEHNKRQDKRIEILEENAKEINRIASSVEKLANNMAAMLKEQEKLGSRLDNLEGADGRKWRKAVGIVATALISGIIGYLLKTVGIF